MLDDEMYVTKRDGNREIVSFDKILKRIKKLGEEAGIKLNYTTLVMKVIDQLYDGISTTKLDELSAEQCASMSSIHPDYNVLAGRIAISNHHKNTSGSFVEVMTQLYQFKDKQGKHSPIISSELYDTLIANSAKLEAMCQDARDYLIDYFGYKTLERAYLAKIDRRTVERPQHMWLRVAMGIHGQNLDRVQETYEHMSQKYFTHATPTLFNSGTPRPQNSSCFLIAMEDDSVDGIYNTLKDCALISKWAGGIGLHIHNIRASGSHIRGTNGSSNGIVPMLKVFNNTAKYIDQGGGRRNGSFAIYLEPWHADIEAFLQMRKNHGDEELKARDLFYALWIPDLFMERVKADGTWTLMCPDECPGLADAVGDAFVELYTKYETAGLGHKTMKARDLWFQVLDAQMETGTPYLCFKDAANKKSNQQNLGTIKSSNLCVAPETMVLTDHGHVEIQTLAGQQVNVWNGHEFSEVTIVQTGTDEELMEVETDDGCKLTCTPYHKFFVGPERTVVEAQHLRRGDVLTTCELPTLGQSVAIKMEWFTEFCAACAYTMEDSHTELILGSNPTDLLLAKYILQTCGVHVAIHENGYILLTASVIQHLIRLGIEVPWPMDSPIQDLDQGPSVSQLGPVRIKRTRKLDRRDATYCFTEPKRSAAVFNGIYTSQCSEIIQYSSPTETAVCNLASIALPAFVRKDTEGKTSIDYEKLHAVTKIVTYNLNRVIDVNYYPTPKTQLSNMRHRPIGIGVQGLADVFMMMDLAFTSEEAQTLNKHIFETIYHGALEQSCDLAEVEGAYETFAGSPASKGLLQFDLWNSDSNNNLNERYDWTELKARIQAVGLRNSLLLAPMPTASTSQILGYNECIEPITSNIYNRRTLAGEFILANKYLMHDLIQLDLWNDKMKNAIIANNGSVQSIETIPQHIRDKYKTVWEIPMRKLIDMAADRGVYICQSQSLNLWLEDPTYNSLTSMHFYSWSKGLKTGIYYLRRRARHHAQQFTIEPTKVAASSGGEEEICEMCSA